MSKKKNTSSSSSSSSSSSKKARVVAPPTRRLKAKLEASLASAEVALKSLDKWKGQGDAAWQAACVEGFRLAGEVKSRLVDLVAVADTLVSTGFEPSSTGTAELTPGTGVWIKPDQTAEYVEGFGAVVLNMLFVDKVVGKKVLVRVGDEGEGTIGFVPRSHLTTREPDSDVATA